MALTVSDLASIPTLLKNYVQSNVTVQVNLGSIIGSHINPGETFSINCTTTNATPVGIALTNVVYHIKVTNSAVEIQAPPNGTTTDSAGNPIGVGTWVSGEIHWDATGLPNDSLGVGNTDWLTVNARSPAAAVPTDGLVQFWITATPNIDYFFPPGVSSGTASVTCNVES